MNKLFKASLVLATVCAFSACSKSGDRPVEAGTDGNKGTGLAVVTKLERTCTTVSITSEVIEGKTVRSEETEIKSSNQTRSTKDKGVNVLIDSTGKYSVLENTLNADGTKSKVREMKYSFVKTDNQTNAKKPANVFYQKDDYVIKKTADDGFFFKDKDGNKVATQERKIVDELEYSDDGVMTKQLSRKIDGVLQPAFPYEYSQTNSIDGDFDVTVEALKAPYTADGVTTESDTQTCRTKKTN